MDLLGDVLRFLGGGGLPDDLRFRFLVDNELTGGRRSAEVDLFGSLPCFEAPSCAALDEEGASC